MPEVNNRQGRDLKPYSLEHIFNQSFDQENQLLVVRGVGSNGQALTFANADNLTYQFDYDSGTNPVYIGIAAPGTSTSAAYWLIKKLTFDGNDNVTAIQYPNGSANFNQIWTDRAGLSYS